MRSIPGGGSPLSLVGGGGEDTLTTKDMEGDAIIDATAGALVADGGTVTFSAFEHYEGGDGADTFILDLTALSVKGGAGDDIIGVTSVETEVDGGDGEDTLTFQFSTEGVDFALSATANIERVLGSDHRDTLLGSASDDRIYGEGGHDLLTGGAGADTLDGGAGADQLVSNDIGNRLIGGAGADRLLVHARENTLAGGAGNDLYDLSELPPAPDDESSPPDAPPEPLTTIEFLSLIHI